MPGIRLRVCRRRDQTCATSGWGAMNSLRRRGPWGSALGKYYFCLAATFRSWSLTTADFVPAVVPPLHPRSGLTRGHRHSQTTLVSSSSLGGLIRVDIMAVGNCVRVLLIYGIIYRVLSVVIVLLYIFRENREVLSQVRICCSCHFTDTDSEMRWTSRRYNSLTYGEELALK